MVVVELFGFACVLRHLCVLDSANVCGCSRTQRGAVKLKHE